MSQSLSPETSSLRRKNWVNYLNVITTSASWWTAIFMLSTAETKDYCRFVRWWCSSGFPKSVKFAISGGTTCGLDTFWFIQYLLNYGSKNLPFAAFCHSLICRGFSNKCQFDFVSHVLEISLKHDYYVQFLLGSGKAGQPDSDAIRLDKDTVVVKTWHCTCLTYWIRG